MHFIDLTMSLYCKNGSRKRPLSVFNLQNFLKNISGKTLFPKYYLTDHQTNSTYVYTKEIMNEYVQKIVNG